MLLVWIGLDAWLDGSAWSGMTVSQSAITVEYCEFNHPHRVFHQPINTYSNLAYFFWGVFILQIAWSDYRTSEGSTGNILAKLPTLSVLTGFCFVYLCFGSGFFHASLTYIGQRADMNATYSILISLFGIALYHVFHRLNLTPTQKNLWVLSLVVLIISFLKIALLIPSSRLVPALILGLNGLMLINYLQFRQQRSLWLIILGFFLIVVAIKIRMLDVQKVNCDPYSFYQGHALWHVLTALSSFCSYAFFRFTTSKPSHFS